MHMFEVGEEALNLMSLLGEDSWSLTLHGLYTWLCSWPWYILLIAYYQPKVTTLTCVLVRMVCSWLTCDLSPHLPQSHCCTQCKCKVIIMSSYSTPYTRACSTHLIGNTLNTRSSIVTNTSHLGLYTDHYAIQCYPTLHGLWSYLNQP